MTLSVYPDAGGMHMLPGSSPSSPQESSIASKWVSYYLRHLEFTGGVCENECWSLYFS